MQSRFDIAVSSEVMAILSIAKDLEDLREKIGKITVVYSKSGKPITTKDLAGQGCPYIFRRKIFMSCSGCYKFNAGNKFRPCIQEDRY